MKKRLLATLMASLMLIPCVPSVGVTAASTLPEFVEGETVYAPSLKGEGQGVPEGWLAVPETQVPWLNGGAAGGWASFDASGTENKAINPACFTYTDKGLAANIGNGDFSVVFPALKDAKGNPVTNYVYSVTVSGLGGSASGSFGPITDAAGDTDYKGGTYLMLYAAGGGNYRHYTYTSRSRKNDVSVPAGDGSAIRYENGRVTVTVYHCNGMNYCFANGKYLYTKQGADAYGDAALNGIGMNFCGAQGIVIEDVTVKKLFTKGVSDGIAPLGASIRYCDADGKVDGEGTDGLRFTAAVDKTSALYETLVPSGTYDPANETVKFGMLLLPTDLLPASGTLTVATPHVSDTVVTRLQSQDDESLTFTVSLLGIPKEQQSRSYTARAYVKVRAGDEWEYTYAAETVSRSYVNVANLFYEDAKSAAVRERLDAIFGDCPDFEGANAKTLSFCLFSDFHYKAGMYMSSIADMETILDRANAADVDFILHAGDFCNDYKGSPELMRAYFENNYGLPAYGIMGNHELETKGNDMALLTTLLANRDVVWGTEDGTRGDGSIGYYYCDVNGFRLICLDTNYSYNTTSRAWEHNPAASSSPPSANKYGNSLGPEQLRWLEKTLVKAAEQDVPCIVVSHAALSGVWSSSPDAETARAIFKKANGIRMGTVLMAINGHLHTNRLEMLDGVLYLDMNTTRNGVWRSDGEPHYMNPKQTFEYVTYSDEGTVLGKTQKELGTLTMGTKTWFFEDPLSATVTVSTSGRIVIEGMETDWIYGVVPKNTSEGQMPSVVSGTFDLQMN
ncbi:MAG: metallophosphoesterase [Clostridia bacterium]|nr:metallophosphoesterase [Clostridia bacterium]